MLKLLSITAFGVIALMVLGFAGAATIGTPIGQTILAAISALAVVGVLVQSIRPGTQFNASALV